ncbi:caspase family protein [Aetokthonos hydrillicola Thurmond2011]|jgi:hypothetical protein|uniref:Caspase family protein n=1 Tax=Aetokthonos hydrillicola Thurmond2011 TaxID=2712845 RepID=A0AAP5MBL7_9CYAN|nr:caspase family protein [Aetokthonos hydrillicola]MBO3459557.1 caspase family protein [Aetokthonos hydrillicola CCALA 1050]MBW4590307.1 caspase family protein [Aetokthonos hydrillicola CCALA 1050]MDR9899405.1 caspase family protein [Aetokthonos hydrillicola Thurmond2011]
MLEREIIPATEEKQKGNFWALLVGVNHYVDSEIKDLMFCVNDVKALQKTLSKLGYEVFCLHDELDDKDSPTRRNVKAKLNILSQTLQPNDLLWVHFSCHGTLTPDKKEPVLILKDTEYSLLDDESEVLSVAQVESYMRKSGARQLILTLDACHSGVNIGRDVIDQQEFFENVYQKAEGFALLAAATANQKAYEDRENGIFSHFLLQGLNSKEVRENKNFITVYQLYSYVLNELRKWGVQKNRLQFPTQRIEGLGDIVLAYYAENVVKSDENIVDKTVVKTQKVKMNLQELIKNGILKELTTSFNNEDMAELLLNAIDFPGHMRPIFPTQGTSLGYWQKICTTIQNGASPRGNDLQYLVDAAADIYPGNSTFQKYRS